MSLDLQFFRQILRVEYEKIYLEEIKTLEVRIVRHCGAEAESLPCTQRSWVRSAAGCIGANPLSRGISVAIDL